MLYCSLSPRDCSRKDGCIEGWSFNIPAIEIATTTIGYKRDCCLRNCRLRKPLSKKTAISNVWDWSLNDYIIRKSRFNDYCKSFLDDVAFGGGNLRQNCILCSDCGYGSLNNLERNIAERERERKRWNTTQWSPLFDQHYCQPDCIVVDRRPSG